MNELDLHNGKYEKQRYLKLIKEVKKIYWSDTQKTVKMLRTHSYREVNDHIQMCLDKLKNNLGEKNV